MIEIYSSGMQHQFTDPARTQVETEKNRAPGRGSLLIGFALLGLQPIPVAALASAGWSSPNAVFLRFLFSTLLIAAICAARRRFLRTKNWPLLLTRGVLGGCAVLLYFYSISHAGAARGTLLNYTYPIWANLLAAAFGQRAPKSFWLGLAAALFGVWLIVSPADGMRISQIGRGELAGLGSAFLAGAAVLSIKKLRETDESMTIVMSFSIIGGALAIPFANFSQIANGFSSLPISIAAFSVAFLAFFGHIFFTRGYRGASLQQATLLSLSVPFIAATAGVLLFNEPFTWRFALGATLIFGSLGLSIRQT